MKLFKGKKKDQSKQSRKTRKDDTKDSSNIDSADLTTGTFDEQYGMQSKDLQKPLDQLELSEQEKNKEHTRILSATNPHAPDNIVRFEFNSSEFKQLPSVDQLAIHFSLSGNLIHVDSDEARRQQQRKQRERMGHRKSISQVDSDEDDVDSPRSSIRRSTIARRPTMVANAPKKALRNQFNFSERAAQTANNPYRQRQVQTVEPPRLDVCLTANQWTIYDAYQKDLARQQAEKEKANKKSSRKTDSKESALAKKQAELELERQMNQNDDLARIGTASKIVERMINQNTYNDIADDYKYFNDDADEFRENGQGTLLPLWKFSYELTNKLDRVFKKLTGVAY